MIDYLAIASSNEWAFQQFQPDFRLKVLVDISATLETMVATMQICENAARTVTHLQSPEVMQAIARRLGSAVGMEAAEVFKLVRMLRCDHCRSD